jgi:hypothetical protein
MDKMEKRNAKTAKLNKSEKHERLFGIIEFLADKEFTGYLKVNFTQCGIGRIEKLEEITLHREVFKE